MFNPLKTRKGRLYSKLMTKFKSSPEAIAIVMTIFDEYEKDNLDTIEKLKRNKKIELAKINGALRQAINAHGPITKELIGSASKRIHGAMLDNLKGNALPCVSGEKVVMMIIGTIILMILLNVFIF